MKKIINLMAIIAILLPVMTSCSGGSDSESVIFGKFPSVYEKFSEEKAKLEEGKKDIKTEAEKAEYLKKVDALKEKWAEKLETAAKTADGQTLEFSESNIKVTEPISLTFKSMDKDFRPTYTVNGKAEAASEIVASKAMWPNSEYVYLRGYDEAGTEVFSTHIGKVAANNVRDGFVEAGTPVEFSTLYFSAKEVEGYLKAKTLKLEVAEPAAKN